MSDPAETNIANPAINKHCHNDSSHTHAYALQPHLTEDAIQFANSIQQQTDFPLPSEPSIPRPTGFDYNPPAYAAVLYNNPQPQPNFPQVRQAVDVQAPPAPVLSQQAHWLPQPETLTQQSQQPDLLGGTSDFTACAPVPQADMRYIGGHPDVLNAEVYDDGRYTKRLKHLNDDRNETDSPRGTLNPKKRGRRAIQNDRPEVEEETFSKRVRGRPRLEATEDVDLKERRKLQIRVAQRAYRERKENAISHLEAQVAGLQAVNAEIKDNYKKILLDYMHEHGIHAFAPELARRLEQFQTLLAARVTEPQSPRIDEAETKVNDAQPESQSTVNQNTESEGVKEAGGQPPQSQALLYGLTVTHEPEHEIISTSNQRHDSSSSLEDSFGGYTVVAAPNLDNASFSSMSMVDPMQDFDASLSCSTLPGPSTSAYMESTFARRLHRRATETAARLINMDNPPLKLMFQVFGFVQNYDTIDKIRERLTSTLNRGPGEDLNAYTEPFHSIGGAGTHFPKTVSSPCASFAENGLGMGPFDERKTHVRDHLLDKLQRTDLPGWQGEWYDSYEVEHYLLSEGMVLPDHDGFVILPPKFASHHDQFPRPGKTNTTPNQNDFSQAPSELSPRQLQRPPLYTSPGRAEPFQLSGTAVQDHWATSPDLFGIHHTTGNYHYPDLMSSTLGGRRVWLSTETFQERLLQKATCIGRGPAFRKENIIPALLDSIRPE